jgi:hypothetical protein
VPRVALLFFLLCEIQSFLFLLVTSPGACVVGPLGWTTIADPETQKEFSAVNCYFMQQDGTTFKAQVKYAPYFLLACKPNCEHDVEVGLGTMRLHAAYTHTPLAGPSPEMLAASSVA